MAQSQTRMQKYIAEEVSKVKGVAYPVRAGKLERAFVRKVSCKKLHPNPDDEFCFPEIGPNEGIVSRYEQDFRRLRENPDALSYADSGVKKALDVQKIYPDGYMILNGHHRWLAAHNAGVAKLPVRIVNLTQERDIRRMLNNSRHDKRVTLDLEEIVFSAGRDGLTEKPLRFPFSRIYKEHLRQGIPALFSDFVTGGYDIWLYSSGYDSLDYVRTLLKHYHAPVTGIVTGTARKAPKDQKTGEKLDRLVAGKYVRTVHVDNDTVLVVDSQSKNYREFPLSGSASWIAAVMETMDKIKKMD